MTVHIITHEACLGHRGLTEFPERPDRLRAIYETLEASELEAELTWHEAPEVERVRLESVHPASYIDKIDEFCRAGGGQLDPDTGVVPESWNAALRAAGGGVAAIELALGGQGHVFVAVRPPGHHAEFATAMGFCLFNNVVVAAHQALQNGGAERVLIVDWDVHHGNGTQDLVEKNPAIHFVSLHQWPLYPGTGRADERGVGNVWNVPRSPGLSPRVYVDDLLGAIDAATEDFTPDLVLISAGYDAMLGDPLAGFTLRAEHYGELTRRLSSLGAPVVAMLEGGYDLDNLRAGVKVTVETLAAA